LIFRAAVSCSDSLLGLCSSTMGIVEQLNEGFHVHLFPVLIIAFLVLRYLYRFICINLLNMKSRTQVVNVDSMIFFFFVSCISAFGWWTNWDESWLVDYDDCYRAWPNQNINYNLKLYYTICLSFYLYGLITLFAEERKKDFTAMLIHHIVTIGLVSLSGAGLMHRIGSVIMLTFDLCDVLLEIAKIAHRDKYHNTSTSFFVIFVIIWTKNRVYNYPMHVLPSAFRAQDVAQGQIPYWAFCVSCLVVIYLLQVYWSFFIVRKIYSLYKKGAADEGDPRETMDEKTHKQ